MGSEDFMNAVEAEYVVDAVNAVDAVDAVGDAYDIDTQDPEDAVDGQHAEDDDAETAVEVSFPVGKGLIEDEVVGVEELVVVGERPGGDAPCSDDDDGGDGREGGTAVMPSTSLVVSPQATAWRSRSFAYPRSFGPSLACV